jgi:hypothetical protein
MNRGFLCAGPIWFPGMVEKKHLDKLPQLIKDIKEVMDDLENIDDDKLLEDTLEDIRVREALIRGYYLEQCEDCEDALMVIRRLNEVSPPWFTEPLVTSEEEIVNGYALYKRNKNIMTYLRFLEFPCPDLSATGEMSYEEFEKQLTEIACSDWYHQDENGNHVDTSTIYDDPEDPPMKTSTQVFETNARALYDLPFSKPFLFETVRAGCKNRLESVRYSNFLGVWMQRRKQAKVE